MNGLQYSGSGVMQQQGAHYIHQSQQQAQQMTQQQQLIAARSSLLYAQQPFSPLAQHQPFHTPFGIASTSTPPPPLHLLHSEPTHVGPTFPDFVRSNTVEGLQGGGKQETGSSAEGRGGSCGAAGETLYLKAADD